MDSPLLDMLNEFVLRTGAIFVCAVFSLILIRKGVQDQSKAFYSLATTLIVWVVVTFLVGSFYQPEPFYGLVLLPYLWLTIALTPVALASALKLKFDWTFHDWPTATALLIIGDFLSVAVIYAVLNLFETIHVR